MNLVATHPLTAAYLSLAGTLMLLVQFLPGL